MLSELQNELDQGLHKMAENSLLKKLNTQGITRADLTDEKYQELLAMETDIIKSDGKKVGIGVGIGIGLSILTGGLF